MYAVPDVSVPDPADDDAYRDLFRDEPVAEDVREPEVGHAYEAEGHEPAPEPELEHVPQPEPAPDPDRAAPRADTGRLFRSARVDSPTPALPAVAPGRAGHLRTLRTDDAAEPTPAAPLMPGKPRADRPKATKPRGALASGPGLNTIGVTVIIGVATAVFGLIDIFVGGPGLGWLTGIAFALATGFAAWRVRLDDAAVAVIAPPLVYFAAVVTLGQIGQVNTAGLLGRAVIVFFMLAANWVWIIGGTVLALAIVLVRSRQSR